jgi:phosphomevalonate kinase
MEIEATRERVLCHAPGKVLITGGYLITEPLYRGISLSLNARFYSELRHFKSNDGVSVSVSIPQFEKEFHYNLKFVNDTWTLNTQYQDFIENTLLIVFNYYGSQNCSLKIQLCADNGFYSNRLEDGSWSLEFLKSLPKFHKPLFPFEKIRKTGIGSSAALVASLTGCLATYFGEVDFNVIHNLAQYSHFYTQKKIGSGFDISTAIYGSQVFRTFEKFNLNDELFALINRKWGGSFEPFNLPKGFYIVLGDVNRGSKTPGMVKAVLSKKEDCKTLHIV